MKKFFGAATMCATMLTPLASVPAYADVIPAVTADGADGTTLASMETQCDALATARETGNGDRWTGTVVVGAVSQVSGPTEVGTHSIADALPGTLQGAGTFTPAHLEIKGDPYRNGGSVNMFGLQQSVGGRYSASTYDYRGEFASTFAHAYTCEIRQEVYHAAYTQHQNAVGIYVIVGDFGNSEDATRGNCAAFTAQGLNDPQPEWFGNPFHGGNPNDPHCKFEGTPASDTEIPESYDAPVLIDTVAGSVNQDQTDTLTAKEDAGEGYDVSDTLLIGQVVVCISPTVGAKKGAPGTWTKQNGYTGDKCTTAWYTSGAMVGVPNLNTGSNNWVTVPVI